MEITLYRWSKYRNSTKQPPANATQITVTGEFKAGYSILHPVLKLSRGVQSLSGKNPAWNYAYSDTTKYYYFIRNWVYESGFWLAYLDYDPLASWKSQILEKNYYVLRSSSDYNGDVPDNTYPTTAAAPMVTSVSSAYPFNAGSDGIYIMGVVNDLGSMSGAITYYAINPIYLDDIFNMLLGSINWANISATEISQQLQKALINPMQYIASLTALPIDYATFATGHASNPKEFRVGWWTINTGNWETVTPYEYISTEITLSIPKHPQASNRGSYLNTSPYSRYTLSFFPFGTFDLDTTCLQGNSTLHLYVQVEYITGQAILSISTSTKEKAFRRVKAQIGTQVPLAQLTLDMQSLAGGFTQTLGGLAGAAAVSSAAPSLISTGKQLWKDIQYVADTGDYALRGANSAGIANPVEVASNIGNTVTAALSNVEFRPAAGSYLDWDQRVVLTGTFLNITSGYPSYIGRPLCDFRTLSTLSGFCKCQLAWPDIDGASMQEQEDIASYLNGGFYIE